MTKFKIFEGKKEDAIEKLVSKYPNDKDIIEKAFGLVSTLGTKVIPFIESEVQKEIVDPQYDDTDTWVTSVKNKLSKFIKNQERITIDTLSSAKQLWDGVEGRAFPKLDKAMKAPKDVNSYTLSSLGYILQVLDSQISQKEKERQAKKEVKKIYDKDGVLMVQVLSHNASCYYGSNTKWCTTSSQPDYFNKYTKDGQLFYVVDKTNRRQKVAVLKNKEGFYVFDSADRQHDLSFLFHVYPELEEFLTEGPFSSSSERKENFKKLKEGKVNRYNVGDVDPLLWDYKKDKGGNPTTLTLEFNGDRDFFDLFDWEGEGDIDKMFLDMAYSNYSNDFIDSYTFEEDWKEGYLFYDFTDEQIHELSEAMKILNPKLYECSKKLKDIEGSDCREEVASYLVTTFDRRVMDIITEKTYDRNREIAEGIKEMFNDEYINIFTQFGIPMTGGFYRRDVSLDSLIKAYEKYNPTYSLDIYGLLKKILRDEGIDAPRVSDSIYEIHVDDFDYSDTKKAIDNLIETMNETIEEGDFDPDTYLQFYDTIKKLGGLEKWVEMPGDDRYLIKVTDIDPEEQTVSFSLSSDTDSSLRKMRLPFDKFNDFIYNRKLFDI